MHHPKDLELLFQQSYHLEYQENFHKIQQDLENYPTSTFAIKLSSLNIREPKHSIVDITQQVYSICQLAEDTSSKIIIDAEECAINDSINQISDEMMREFNGNQVVVYKTYQMYRRDTTTMLLNDLNTERDYSLGCKLVRGAYYNLDIATDKLFWRIEDTHRSYNEGIKVMNLIKKIKS